MSLTATSGPALDRALAGAYMRNERAGHTLQPTALVHDAYLRMLEVERIDWKSESHCFAMAARQMRRILIDRAHRKRARKRGGGAAHLDIDDQDVVSTDDPTALIALDEALKALRAARPEDGAGRRSRQGAAPAA